MKKLLFAYLLCIGTSVLGQGFLVQINLKDVQEDRLKIQMNFPPQNQKSILVNFPKIVPGTYANYDYGRYIENFQAFDQQGKKLAVTKKNVNQYQISEANKLAYVRYEANDTWDSPEIKGEYIFEPAGSNFQKDTLFALNTHTLLAYVSGQEKQRIKLQIEKPSHLVGVSSLKNTSKGDIDTYNAISYQELVDSPIMYSPADTAKIMMGETEIVISLYTPNATVTSKQIASQVEPLLDAQRKYLGGKLPVNRYAFLIVLSDNLKGGSYGALEHAQSSFYYLPEGNIEQISQTIRDVCAHEFFHIVTPLSIHSEEIGSFDFNEPKMSQHLWLYEGLTEYAAHHMQAKYALTSWNDFFKTIQEKKETMDMQFDASIPFTVMSKNVLSKYKEQYGNVYEKGALIGWGLDLFLRQQSNGAYGTQQMMTELAKTYGPTKSFKDDELFEALVRMTKMPALRDFFTKYVAGNEELPIEAWLQSIGYTWDMTQKEEIKSPGFDPQGLAIKTETKRAYVENENAINVQGQTLGLQPKDEFISLNGLPIDVENFSKNMKKILQIIQPGDLLSFEIARPDGNGGYTTLTLKAPFTPISQVSKSAIRPLLYPTAEQLKLREDWKRANP
jgi:predicted metalloprotease with PDZ domain